MLHGKFRPKMLSQDSEQKVLKAPPMSPRISFSNDFVETSHSHSQHQMRAAAYRDAPVSPDFEFSVSNYQSMMSADELFSKGRLLPYTGRTTTLREELQNQEDENDGFSLRPPKSPIRLRGFLGLRKSHISSKKSVNADGSSAKQLDSDE